MFLRLQRAYYRWRLRLVLLKIAIAEHKLVQAKFQNDAFEIAYLEDDIEFLRSRKLYLTYQLCRLPQPT